MSKMHDEIFEPSGRNTMTKESLKFNLKHNHENSLDEILDEFFEQNVVIPKGENRHPYADVLHEWIEGADLQIADDSTLQWRDYPLTAEEAHGGKYRIKPSEPIYEWQWELFYDGRISISDFMTEYEVVENYGKNHGRVKREETKRKRKA